MQQRNMPVKKENIQNIHKMCYLALEFEHAPGEYGYGIVERFGSNQ